MLIYADVFSGEGAPMLMFCYLGGGEGVKFGRFHGDIIYDSSPRRFITVRNFDVFKLTYLVIFQNEQFYPIFL